MSVIPFKVQRKTPVYMAITSSAGGIDTRDAHVLVIDGARFVRMDAACQPVTGKMLLFTFWLCLCSAAGGLFGGWFLFRCAP